MGTDQPFFDLKGYFDQEVDRIRQFSELEKSVTHQGVTETRKIPADSSQIAADISAFSKADLNRPDWVDKYRVDSLTESGGLRVTYSALEDDLRVRKIELLRQKNGAMEEIRIWKRSESPIADFEQKLRYLPDSGFRIRSEQVNALGGRDTLAVEVSWKNKR